MAKKWSELKVGDKVVAVEDGLFVTKDKIYKISAVYGKCIEFIDDKGDFHDATEEWVLKPYEESTHKANGILNVEVNVDALHTTPNVYPGQVRMSTDGFVILVIHAIYGLDEGETEGYYNSIILCDPLGNELDFECNLPVRNQSGDDIANEYPILLDAKLTIDKVNGGNA